MKQIALVVCLSIVTRAPLLGAQTVQGRVAVLDVAEPVPGAAVVLMGADGRPYDAVMSDSAGYFELSASDPGDYFVHAFSVGFAEVRSDLVRLNRGSTVEVRINLRPVAVAIEGITVYGLDRYGGFRERRRGPESFRFGSFDSSEIERIGATGVRDVMNQVPLFRGRCFTAWWDGRRLDQDDWLYKWLLGVGGFPRFPVASVYGVEVFRNRGDAPREYRLGGSAHCGVVLVWTKVAGRR